MKSPEPDGLVLKVESLGDLPFRGVKGTRPTRPWNCTTCKEQIVLYKNDEIVSYSSLVVRQAEVNGQFVKMGGIGYGMTLEEEEGQGYSSQCVARAIEEFESRGVDIILLTCLDTLVNFYKKLGLTIEVKNVWIEQPGLGTVHAPDEIFFLTKVLNDRLLPIRKIDLKGLPW